MECIGNICNQNHNIVILACQDQIFSISYTTRWNNNKEQTRSNSLDDFLNIDVRTVTEHDL